MILNFFSKLSQSLNRVDSNDNKNDQFYVSLNTYMYMSSTVHCTLTYTEIFNILIGMVCDMYLVSPSDEFSNGKMFQNLFIIARSGQISFTFPSNAKTNCYHLIIIIAMVVVSGFLLTTLLSVNSKQ